MDFVPHKTKVVEEVSLLSRKSRRKKLEAAGYNLFFLNSKDVYIDLLTDSGTGAMSNKQWAGMICGDESYAGSESFKNLQRAVEDITGFPYLVPTHQGRGAENVFSEVMIGKKFAVPGNAHFDTTKAHIKYRNGLPIDCTIQEAYDLNFIHPFKGNVDLEKLEAALRSYEKFISYILITVTCNQIGGQPVSLENIKRVSAIAKKYKVPLFYDGARFAENAFFIKEREHRYRRNSIRQIVKEMMLHVDGMLMSAKKDAIVPMGGFIALRNENLYKKLCPIATLMEGLVGFISNPKRMTGYGGMSGSHMEALAIGLYEGTSEKHLRHKISQIKYLNDRLSDIGMPVMKPAGGHGVYVDAAAVLPQIPWHQFPGQALAIALYLESGIRSVEVGSLMEGRDPKTGESLKAQNELLRLAIPARVYSKEHIDSVIEAFEKILRKKNRIRGVKFVYESPILRHFSSSFAMV